MNIANNTDTSLADIYSSTDLPEIREVWFANDNVYFQLNNRYIIGIPVSLTKLKDATQAQKENFELTPRFVFWDGVDEIIGVKNLLNGSLAGPSKGV